MRHLFSSLLFFFVVSVAFAEDRPLTIGISAPLSGDVAAWGQDTQRALTLANELLADNEVKLIFEDDRCLGKQAVTNAQKLIDIDKIHFGMTVCTEPTLSVAPIFNQKQVILMSPGGTGAAVSEAGEYVFRTWPSDREMVRLVFDYVNSRHSRIALLSESRGFPQEFHRVFLELAEDSTLKVNANDFQTEEGDFRSLLLRIRQDNPDALIVNPDSERTIINILSQMRQIGWEVPIYSNFIAGTNAFLSKAGDLAEGIIFGDSPIVDCGDEQPGCEVYSEFFKRHGSAASSEYMVASSIASFSAVRAAFESDSPKDYLLSSSFESAIGKFSFDENGDVIGPHPVLRRVEQGKGVLINR